MYNFSVRIEFSPGMLPRFCFLAGLSPGSWRRFFLCGIPERTDSLVGFLLRCIPGIFLEMDLAGKTGHLGGTGILGRILAPILNTSQGSFKVVL